MTRRFEKLPNDHAVKVLAKHPHGLAVTPGNHKHAERGCQCVRIDKDVWSADRIVRPKLGFRGRLLSAMQARGR